MRARSGFFDFLIAVSLVTASASLPAAAIAKTACSADLSRTSRAVDKALDQHASTAPYAPEVDLRQAEPSADPLEHRASRTQIRQLAEWKRSRCGCAARPSGQQGGRHSGLPRRLTRSSHGDRRSPLVSLGSPLKTLVWWSVALSSDMDAGSREEARQNKKLKSGSASIRAGKL